MAVRRFVGAAMLVAVCGAGAAGALHLARSPLGQLVEHLHAGGWEVLPLETAVTALAAAVLASSAVWLALVTAATAVGTLAGASPAVLRSVSPAVVRRAVAICCGLAVGTGGSLAATADPSPPEPGRAVAADLLSGLPLPDRATGGTSGAARTDSLPESTAARSYVVRRGDSLWAIASRLLGSTEPGRVDAAWRSLYRANRVVVGDDPDLLRPGTLLHLPATLTTPGPSRGDGATPSRIDRKDAS